MEFVTIFNLTPDSFSDGGENTQIEVIEKKLIEYQSRGLRIFDFGAESTAPFNDPIDLETELSRYQELLFPLIEKKIFEDDVTFSIDTYKSEIFEKVYQQIRQFYPESKVWWNDVSGIVEQADWELLSNLDNNTSYIYSHTFVPTKADTSQHMNFVNEDLKAEDLAKEMSEKFVTFQFNWNFKGIKSELILDPCFGFSKSSKQNYGLIGKLGKVFKNVAIDVPVMLGLSRKSFLRSLVKNHALENLDTEDRQALNLASEALHWQVIQKLNFDLRTRKKFIRAHDPLYFLATQELWDHVNII
jgi:dihydropteroate synthase